MFQNSMKKMLCTYLLTFILSAMQLNRFNFSNVVGKPIPNEHDLLNNGSVILDCCNSPSQHFICSEIITPKL